MAGDDDEMFMTKSHNVTLKTTEQHLIVCSDNFVAYVTNNKRLCSTFSTITTDRHEASRGLSATAELLVLGVSESRWRKWLRGVEYFHPSLQANLAFRPFGVQK